MEAGTVTGVVFGMLDQAFVDTHVIAEFVAMIGWMFVDALQKQVVPLVLFSPLTGVTGIGDIRVPGGVGANPSAISLRDGLRDHARHRAGVPDRARRGLRTGGDRRLRRHCGEGADCLNVFAEIGLFIQLHLLGTRSILLKLLSWPNPTTFIELMRPAQVFAVSRVSSNATIRIIRRSVTERVGVDEGVASFCVSFGATVDMDGIAIMQDVATMFLATSTASALESRAWAAVVGMAILATIGTASMTGAGLVMPTMVLTRVGLPIEGIAIILGVGRRMDMIRMVVNITGDAVVTTIVARGPGQGGRGNLRRSRYLRHHRRRANHPAARHAGPVTPRPCRHARRGLDLIPPRGAATAAEMRKRTR